MPKIRRGRQRKDYRVADAAKKNPENETEEVVVAEDVEEMDDLDDDDMDNNCSIFSPSPFSSLIPLSK